MKRLLTTLLFLVLSFGLFAETGYNNKAWKTEKGQVQFMNIVPPGDGEAWKVTEAERKVILGNDTVTYYHYFGNRLNGVSYTLPKDKIKTLKNKFAKKLEIKKTITITKAQCMEWYKQGMGEETDEDLAMNFQMWLVAFCDEMKQTSVTDLILKDKGTGTITVYDYNDDTRVYILENVVEDKIFVIYLYHEQDY